MQPARAEVVQNLIFPASAATTGDFFGREDVVALVAALRRAGRRSRSCSAYGPTTGKTIGCGTPSRGGRAAAGPASSGSGQDGDERPLGLSSGGDQHRLRFALEGGR